MEKTPLVTIVLPVLNCVGYIGEAIDSIINQTHTEWELYIVDDGSTDGTIDKIKEYRDDRVKLIVNEKREGLPKSRNMGIKKAKGKYICVQDADDLSSNDRIEKQLNYFKSDDDLHVLGTSFNVIDEKSKIIRTFHVEKDLTMNDFSETSAICHGTAMILKDTLFKVGLYDPLFNAAQDYGLFIKLIKDGYKMKIIPDVLYSYRVHDDRLTVKAYSRQLLSSLLARTIYFDQKISRENLPDNLSNQEIYKLLSYKHKLRYMRHDMRKKNRENKNFNYLTPETIKLLYLYFMSALEKINLV
jgi:glycosyltransferase involved in cell wall biosynthesis